jgi:CopG family nickel-responsive transcriptional regulator
MSTVRFGVSLEKKLLESLDAFSKKNGFPNRSQAIRYLINEYIVNEKWDENAEVAGSISIVYDHHKRNLLNKLNEVQHDYHEIILSNLHFHIDHHNCMEIIAIKGKAKKLRELAEKIITIKGVEHGKLTMTH